MNVKHFFKASGTTQQTMQPYIPEDFNIHLHHCENLKNCKDVPLILLLPGICICKWHQILCKINSLLPTANVIHIYTAKKKNFSLELFE